MVVNALTSGVPLPQDGSLFGWTHGGAVTALVAVYTQYTPTSPVPVWTIMPLAGVPEPQWPPFTDERLFGPWFWEHFRIREHHLPQRPHRGYLSRCLLGGYSGRTRLRLLHRGARYHQSGRAGSPSRPLRLLPGTTSGHTGAVPDGPVGRCWQDRPGSPVLVDLQSCCARGHARQVAAARAYSFSLSAAATANADRGATPPGPPRRPSRKMVSLSRMRHVTPGGAVVGRR